MQNGGDAHRLGTLEQVREIIGEESGAVRAKIFDALDETAREFVRRSPLLLLATSDAAGHPDVTPRGDEPGFVAAPDAHTLWIPERKGNRMILGLRNVLANPKVESRFFHCAKAFKRSRLWQPASWPAPLRISFGKLLARKLGGAPDLERAIDLAIEEDYAKNL